MHSLDAYAQDKLASLRERHLYRALNETLREDGIWVERHDRRLLSFSCNDYLNLTQHPAIKKAAIAAIEELPVLVAGKKWRGMAGQIAPVGYLVESPVRQKLAKFVKSVVRAVEKGGPIPPLLEFAAE